jgi:hypothetical protein
MYYCVKVWPVRCPGRKRTGRTGAVSRALSVSVKGENVYIDYLMVPTAAEGNGRPATGHAPGPPVTIPAPGNGFVFVSDY